MRGRRHITGWSSEAFEICNLYKLQLTPTLWFQQGKFSQYFQTQLGAKESFFFSHFEYLCCSALKRLSLLSHFKHSKCSRLGQFPICSLFSCQKSSLTAGEWTNMNFKEINMQFCSRNGYQKIAFSQHILSEDVTGRNGTAILLAQM